MKKTLLPLGLLGLVFSAEAQWVSVNQTNVQSPPSYNILQVHTVSPTVMWGVAEEAVASANSNNFVRTSNAAGTEFEYNGVTGSAGFAVANIFGLSATTAVAAQYNPTPGAGGGEIVRTTNGGNTWSVVTTRSQFTPAAGFNNFVAMFDANEGVSFGDPNGGNFEVLRTTNGGTSWTRVPNASLGISPLTADEYGLVNSFFVLGNTIWAGNSHVANMTPLQGRIFKSTDRGLTWRAYNVPIMGGVSNIAFTDQNNGLANTGLEVAKTTDGGVTWTTVTPVNGPAGRFYQNDIDAIPGTNAFISAGASLAAMNTIADFGTSISTDGITWRNISGSAGVLHFSVDAISNNHAYSGGRTNAMTGAGGVYRWGGAVLNPSTALGTKNNALQKALAVFPNPSSNGVFKVEMSTGMTEGTTLTVTDALGRKVTTRTLNATSVAAKSVTLDLNGQKAGVYTLEVRNNFGVAQQKLVIE